MSDNLAIHINIDDPTKWVTDLSDKDNTVDMLNTHHAERLIRGFSRYDWYNFHNYIEYLIKIICLNVNNGDIIVDSEQVHTDVKRVLDIFNQAGVKMEEDENTFDVFQSEIAADLNSQAVQIFFKNIFPKLPYSTDRYYTPITSQSPERIDQGFSADDAKVIRSYLSSILIEGISWFASIGSGYFGESSQWWENELRTMERGLRCLHTKDESDILSSEGSYWEKECKVAYVNGMDTLIKYFDSLWD